MVDSTPVPLRSLYHFVVVQGRYAVLGALLSGTVACRPSDAGVDLDHDLEELAVGAAVSFDSAAVAFEDWYPAEATWRWSRGRSAALRLRFAELDTSATYLLQLDADVLTAQEVLIELDGRSLGRLRLGTADARRRLLAVPGELLQPHRSHRLRFEVERTAQAQGDPRQLGLALRSLRLHAWPGLREGVAYDAEPYFDAGWSEAEDGFRWSRGKRASLVYPVAGVERDAEYTLELVVGAFGDQTLRLRLNGDRIGTLLVEEATQSYRLSVPGRVLLRHTLNRVELEIPGARGTDLDSRSLGIRLVSLRIV